MTLDSRRYEVFRRLGVKLLIEDAEAKGFPPKVARLIQPVVDVSDLLLLEDAATASEDLTGSAGNTVVYFTVPTGERWHMRLFSREVAIAASHLIIIKAVPVINFQFTGNTQTAQFGDFAGIVLQEADRIGLAATGDPGDTAIFLHIMFGRELLG